MSRLDELRELLRKVEDVAAQCIARSTDPKDRADHERWRDQKVAELRAEITRLEEEACR